MQDKNKQLEKLAKIFNTEAVLTPEDIAQVVEGIAKVLNSYRESSEKLNAEQKQTLERAIAYISEEHDKVLTSVEKTSEKAVFEATEAINSALVEVKKLAKEVLEAKPRDGKDADETIIVEKVLEQIVLPEYKETVLDNGDQIIDKINESDKKIKAERIEGDGFVTQKNLDRAISILDQRTSFLINKQGTSSTPGVTSFLNLTDTPSSYSGQSGKAVVVNGAETGLEFVAVSGTGTVTSVGVSVPTGLTVSGSPVTTSGTIAIGLDTGRVIPLQSTIDGKVPYTGATANVDLGAFSLITDKITSKTSAGLTLENNSGGDVLHIGNGGGVNATAYGGWNFDSATANTVAVFGASKTLSSSSVTTTELGYVSGVTSAIQTQLGNRALTGAVTGSGITMSTARILGRTTASTGAIEEISIGSGLSLSAGVLSATGGGITDGDKGDITVSSSGTEWTIDNTAVTYAKIQNVAANTFLANATGSAATVQEISTARIPLFASAITGTPSSTTFLRGDGTWATPSGGGSPGGSNLEMQYNDAGVFGGATGTAWDNSLTKYTLTKTNGGTANTPTTSGFSLENKTAATVSQSQFSPSMRWVAQGWKTNATAGSQEVIFNAWLQTRNGNVNPSPQLVFAPTINGTSAGGIAFASSLNPGTGPTSGTFITGLDGVGSYGVDTGVGWSGIGPNGGSNSFAAYCNAGRAFIFVTGGAVLPSGNALGFSSGVATGISNADVIIRRDGAGQMAQRNGTNSQSFRVYKTFTDASNFERLEINGTSTSGWLQIIANSAGTGSANLGIALTPRGTGAISAQVPDGATAGGNTRGANAVDFQQVRSTNTNVASGNTSFLGGGTNNRVSNNNGVCGGGLNNVVSGGESVVAGGQANQATNSFTSVLGGISCIASGAYSTVGGGGSNTASGNFSWIPGGQNATTRSIIGARAYSSGQRVAQGDAQVIGHQVRVTTTATSTADLTANGGAVSSTNVMVLPNNSSAGFVAKVAARNATTVGSGYWEVRGTIERGANAASTALVGSVTVTSFGISASLGSPTVTVVANTTQGGAVVQVTPANTDTTYWVADLELIQVA